MPTMQAMKKRRSGCHLRLTGCGEESTTLCGRRQHEKSLGFGLVLLANQIVLVAMKDPIDSGQGKETYVIDDETESEQTFPAEYAAELNRECKKWRLRLEDKQREYETLQAQLVELEAGGNPEVERLNAECEDLEQQLRDLEAGEVKKG